MLCIGPAGVAGVAYSSIVADGSFMAEPAGTGAIMANKRIKAIAVRGGTPIALSRHAPGRGGRRQHCPADRNQRTGQRYPPVRQLVL